MTDSDNGERNWQTLGAILAAKAAAVRHGLDVVPAWAEAGRMTEEKYRHLRLVLPFADASGDSVPAFAGGRPATDVVGRGDLPLSPPEDEQAPASRDDLSGIVGTSSISLDAGLVRLLEDMLGRPLPAVHVHANTEADRVVRARNADALTFGDRVAFREGGFRPEHPGGLALLGHELVHADAIRSAPDPAPRSAAADAEEGRALRAERTILASVTPDPASGVRLRAPLPAATHPALLLRGRTPPSVPPTVSRDRGAAPRARAADTGRDVSAPAQSGAPAATSSGLSDSQMVEIKEAVYRDLMERIRTDFERGG